MGRLVLEGDHGCQVCFHNRYVNVVLRLPDDDMRPSRDSPMPLAIADMAIFLGSNTDKRETEQKLPVRLPSYVRKNVLAALKGRSYTEHCSHVRGLRCKTNNKTPLDRSRGQGVSSPMV
jgi:hypothetical protein